MVSSWIRSLTRTPQELRADFERHMAASQRQAFSTAYRLTGSSTEAEDLVQETYVRAFRFFHRYNAEMPFSAWLLRIMTNLHIDQTRRRRRLTMFSLDAASPESGQAWEVADESAAVDAALLDASLDDRIQYALKTINVEFRTAVVLADVEGMSYEEIAEIMGTSVGTVRSRIHRGRKQLRSFLGEDFVAQHGGAQ